MVLGLLGLLETRHTLELGASEGSRGTRLERASEEKLRGQKRRELHVKGGSRGRNVVDRRGNSLGLIHGLSIERWDVPTTTRVAIGKARDVRGEGTVREASVALRRLRAVSEAAIRSSLANRSIEILHTEQMRGDLGVPPNVG